MHKSKIGLLLLISMLSFSSMLSAQIVEDCDNCFVGEFFFDPPIPESGSYPPGTAVTVYLDILNFQTPENIWPHAAFLLAVGDGFDSTSVEFMPPISCTNTGEWYYNPVPWVGCYSGLGFSNAIVFDGNQGLICGGGPNDGDPGNNWGDGAIPCADRIFGWRFITNANSVSECPSAKYSIAVEIASDKKTGSWSGSGGNDFFIQTACFPQVQTQGLQLDFDENGQLEVSVVVIGDQSCSLTYEWEITTPDGQSTTSNDPAVRFDTLNNYRVCVGNGICQEDCYFLSSDDFDDLPPFFGLYPNDTLCHGEEFTLIAVGGDSIVFVSPNGILSQHYNFVNLVAEEGMTGIWSAFIYRLGVLQAVFNLEMTVGAPLDYSISTDPTDLIAGETAIVNLSSESISTVSWNLGDSIIFEGLEFTYLFPDSGTYNFELSLTGAFSCRRIDTLALNVGFPELNFQLRSQKRNFICEGNLIPLVVEGDSLGSEYHLTGPDGQFFVSEEPFFVLTPEEAGNYSGTWTVEIYSPGGLLGTAQLDLLQLPNPETGYSITGLNENGTANANQLLTFTPDQVSVLFNHDWIINGEYFSQDILEYSFTEAGVYPIKLITKVFTGCVGILDSSVVVVDSTDLDNKQPLAIAGQGQVKPKPQGLSWKVSPNPGNGRLRIQIDDQEESLTAGILLTVYDQSGAAVHQERLTELDTYLDLSQLPAGVYTLSGVLNNQSLPIVKKIVIQH